MTQTKFDSLAADCYVFTPSDISSSSPPGIFSSATTELNPKMHHILGNMRYLTHQIDDPGKTHNTDDIISFIKMRTYIVQELLYLAPTPNDRCIMTLVDYYAENFRLAAMIYVKSVLHVFLPFCPMLKNLKKQVLDLKLESEKGTFGDLASMTQPDSAIWAFMVEGLLSSNEDEERQIAEKVALGARLQNIHSWDEMEHRLREICWLRTLKTEVCNRIWKKVDDINRDLQWGE